MKKKESLSSVMREEVRLTPDIVGTHAHYVRGKNIRILTSSSDKNDGVGHWS